MECELVMASLPSNTFMFNYNAREYNSSTYTFPKTEGQLFDEDLVLNKNPNTYTEEYVYFGNTGVYMQKQYGSTLANPFNRDGSHNSFTMLYKTSGDTGNQNIFANRGSNYNYMVRPTMFHTSQSGFLSLTANTDPHICLIRIYSDGTSERKFLDSSGNVLQSTSASSISWGGASNAFGFFVGYGTSATEFFTSYFYWMYLSLETLTDAEVLKVIQYNENTGPTFEADTTAVTATYSATTTSVTLTADEEVSWTASTNDSWITVSPVSGTGSGVITISLAKNTAYTQRVGTVTLTNGEDTIEIECSQAKHPVLVPKNNIYREGRLVN
jgi:hypothetical protein